MRRRDKRLLSNRNFFAVCFLIIIALFFTLVVNLALRPVIYDISAQAAKSKIATIINEAVCDALIDEQFDYDSIVVLNYNADGYVSSVEYNYAYINNLKLKTEKLLLNKLDKLKNTKIKIPLGSLTGDVNSSGRGACLKIKLSQISIPNISITSSFEAMGINQTKHEIRLVINAHAQMYLPPDVSEFTYTQEYVLAQTIIVGDIPQGVVTLE